MGVFDGTETVEFKDGINVRYGAIKRTASTGFPNGINRYKEAIEIASYKGENLDDFVVDGTTIRRKNFWERCMTNTEASALGKLAAELGLSVTSDALRNTGTIKNKHGRTWVVHEAYIRDIEVMDFIREMHRFAEEGAPEIDEPEVDAYGLIKW